VATEGPAPAAYDKKKYKAVEQWEAHAAVPQLTKQDAQKAYCALLVEVIPEYLFADEDDDSAQPCSVEELPDGIQKQLEDNGIGAAAGAETDAEEPDGLHSAVAAGKLKWVKVLLGRAPAAINELDADTKATPLMLACDRDQPEIATYLTTQPGVDLNVVDADGMTALHYAVIIGSPALVTCLLAAGADAHIADSDGADPLTMAQDDGAADLVALLEKADHAPR
jgi:hypothetical protein